MSLLNASTIHGTSLLIQDCISDCHPSLKHPATTLAASTSVTGLVATKVVEIELIPMKMVTSAQQEMIERLYKPTTEA